MLDPVFIIFLALTFALMFLLAARHKLADFARFRAVLSAYRILPDSLVTPAARCIAALEAVLAIAWILGLNLVVTGVATAALLGLYSLAIGLNLARGRVYIDCGCDFGTAGGNGQQLSGRLLLRNVLLIAAALAATLPPAPRELLLIEYVGLAWAWLVLALLYLGGNQLLRNAQAIKAWRKPSAGSGKS